MYCPVCKYLLQKLSVTTSSGGKFDVDHCGRCAGTWFDPYEINRIPFHEVARLAQLTILPKKPVLYQLTPKCPRCHKILSEFSAGSIPSGIKFLRCRHCLGIWASQKALVEFKENQESTVKEYRDNPKPFPALSVVFAPIFFTLLLFLTTAITINKFSDTRDGRIKASEMISNIYIFDLTQTSAILSFNTKINLKSEIAYGPTRLEYQTKTISSEAKKAHLVKLDGLKPKTLYFYQITLYGENNEIISSDEQSFVTR